MFVLSERNGIGRLTFAQEGGRNLLDAATLTELAERLEEVAAKPWRGLLIDSAAPRIFAAGADLEELRAFDPAAAAAFSRTGQQVLLALERLPQLSVAVVRGACMGGGLDLALACDVRLAHPSARFAHPGVRLGIVTGFSGTWRWSKVLASPAARRLFIGGEAIDAVEALRLGLADAMLPEEGWLEEADLAVTRLLDELPIAELAVFKSLAPRWSGLTRAQSQLLESRTRALYRLAELKPLNGHDSSHDPIKGPASGRGE